MVKESRLDQFCEETSILGFKYIKSDYKRWFRLVCSDIIILEAELLCTDCFYKNHLYNIIFMVVRLMSAMVVTLCIGLTVFQVGQRVKWYINNPLSFEEKKIPYIDFPTILVCNDMQMRLVFV